MTRKGFNWKARQVIKTSIDDGTTKQIALDLKTDGHYDKSNALVLPSSKRKTKIIKDKTAITRILSKQHRKRLEKIVDRKAKKDNRASLLEALAKVQATPEELNKLTSIASVQTKGLKKHFLELQFPQRKHVRSDVVANHGKIDSLSGTKRKRLQLLQPVNATNDDNVVGFEASASESESEAEIQVEPIKKQKICDVSLATADVIKTATKTSETIANCMKVDDKMQTKQISVDKKPSVFVEVDRKDDMQKARLKLPILAEEQQIMETINENQIILLAGETGSGKTTQVPQFLYEAGYALTKLVGITEPRRVAAIAMSRRVAQEMNLPQSHVSYVIRFEGNVTDDTKLKFMTDGVLLKEIQTDFLLSKYSVIILDEAHERSVYTDILIGLLSRIVPLRNKRGDPMKLIIMSATLRLQDFTENQRLFKSPPPVIKVDARQFPVTIHFNKRTNSNYLQEAFNKAVKVHTKLPEGGLLIFVTGQHEVNSLVRKLRRTFPARHGVTSVQAIREDEGEAEEEEDGDVLLKKRVKRKKVKILPKIDLDDYCVPDNEDPDLSEEDDLDLDALEEEADADDASGGATSSQPLWVLPLYSQLPSHQQALVFQAAPPGCRLCVVSTNVAETSLTIPNVKYVIDTGKTKCKLYDKVTGVSRYVVDWTCQASADQRAGRAGRTAPGHCYRLYSSAMFNDTFAKFSIPEIQQKPVDDLYLQMKCMNIDKIVNFPFPSAPDLLQLKAAEHRLRVLGALTGDGSCQVTSLGRAIAKFPVLPRYGKMLALSHQHGLLPYTVCMVAALSVQEVLLETPLTRDDTAESHASSKHKWMAIRRQWAGLANSLLLGDPMVLLRAVGAAEFANSSGTLTQFCASNGLREKALREIRKLRLQLTHAIQTNIPDTELLAVDPHQHPPNDTQAKLLRQILLAGMGDQVAKKVSLDEVKAADAADKHAFKYAYKANGMDEFVYLHQGSVLKRHLPEFVVYQEIYETNKLYMRGVTAIEPEWLPQYVPHLCQLSAPLVDPAPSYDSASGRVLCSVTGTFGPQAWALPALRIEFPAGSVEGYRWFARCVLEGEVCAGLARYRGVLLSVPGTMVKTWAKLQPRTEVLLKALMARGVDTKQALLHQWTLDATYLLSEYLKWLPESAHSEVSLCWPPTQ